MLFGCLWTGGESGSGSIECVARQLRVEAGD